MGSSSWLLRQSFRDSCNRKHHAENRENDGPPFHRYEKQRIIGASDDLLPSLLIDHHSAFLQEQQPVKSVGQCGRNQHPDENHPSMLLVELVVASDLRRNNLC